MSRLLDNLVIFGRILRRAGIHVHSARVGEIVAALRDVDLTSRDDVYHVCRTLIVQRQDQIALFDAAFAAFWRQHRDAPVRGPQRAVGAAQERSSLIEIEDRLALESGDDAQDATASP